ncbi:MAG: type II toxin-antitoxin system prevent-host-death family antitoxin [Terracidiphilus sp.]
MPSPLTRSAKRAGKSSPTLAGRERWKLEDAKAKLSEVVRLAATNGPQWVTIRGKEAAVVIAPEQYRQLLPKPKGHQTLVRFLQGLGLEKLDIERENDTGRELTL